ncbi:cyclic nucleotide-binding domain-containing protein [Candidatus Peregrinibacteria bacterium]|nr:cyclic nucleotide-binding domain-containing protein [Candidatus Peregrinibacteria bacterium]
MPNQNEQDLHIVANLLKSIPLFETLNEAQHAEIIKHISMEYYPENHLLFQVGDPGTCMYIIKNGIVRIYQAGETASFDKEIAMLGDNDFFGEMALISDQPRNANAKVVQDAQLFVIKKEDFLKLISENPEIAERISKEFLDRVKVNTREKNA